MPVSPYVQPSPKDPEGLKDLMNARFHGADDNQIQQYKDEQTKEFKSHGASDDEIRKYWGDKDPDTSDMKTHVKDNLAQYKESQTPTSGEPGKPSVPVSHIDSFTDAYHAAVAGLEASTGGLMVRGGMPEQHLAQNPSLGATILYSAGQFVGDAPAMIAGGFMGSVPGFAAGGVVPGVGNLAGAAAGFSAGAFAVPASLRKMLIDHYEKGDIQTPGEFLSRLSATSWEAIKGATVGLLTSGAGTALENIGANTYAKMAGELGVMTGASSALEGHMPTANELAANAVLLTGLHSFGVLENFGKKYKETGMKPAEIVQQSVNDPILHQEMLQTPKPEVPKNSDVERIKDPGDDANTITYASPTLEKQTKDTSVQDKGIPRTEAENKILSHIGESDMKAPRLPIKDMIGRLKNDLHPFKEYFNEIKGDVKLTPEQNFVATTKLYRNWTGKLDVFMQDGTFSTSYESGTKNYKRTGDSFYQVLDKIPTVEVDGKTVSDDAGAIAYMSAKRAIHLSERVNSKGEPIETGFNLDAAKEVVRKGKRFEEFHKSFQAFGERMLDYAEEQHLLSKEDRQKISDISLDYAPLHAVQEYDAFGGKGSGGAKNLKRQTGSDAKKLNPIEQQYKNTAAILRVAERNKIGLQMLEAMEKNPEASKNFVRKLDRDIVPIEVQVSEMKKALKDVPGSEHLTDEDLKAFNIFRAKDVMIGKDNILRVKRNGKSEYLEISDGVSQAMNALDIKPFYQNPMWKILTAPSKWLRLGVTKDPAFAQGTNVARDAGTALTTEGIIPFSKTKETMGEILNRKPDYIQMMLHGGASGDVQSHVEFLKEDVLKAYKESKSDTAIEAVWNRIKSPVQSLSQIGTALENSTRLAAFKKRGGGVEGALSARDSTVDFTEGTAFTRAWSQIDAFFNPSVQGAARVIEAFGPEQIQKTLKYGLGGITTFSVMNWWRNKDRYEYITGKRWEKKNNWLFPMDSWEKAYNMEDYERRPEQMRRIGKDGSYEVNNSTVLRFPKPPGFGQVFGSSVESLLDAAYDEYRKNPNASNLYTDLKEDMAQALSTNIWPDSIRPVLEQMTNHVFFTDQPIVNKKLEEVAPELQYKEYTSQTARQLGKIIQAVPLIGELGTEDLKISSPLVVENYLREWGGGLGKLATDVIDSGLRKAGIATDQRVMPESTLSDIPFVRAFVARNPTMQSQVVVDFYDKASDLDRKINTSKAMYKEAEKLLAANEEHPNPNTYNRANEMMRKSEDLYNKNAEAQGWARGVADTIKGQNILIQKIMLDDSMKPHDKRQLIDGIYYQMIEFSRLGNVKLSELEKVNKGN